MNTLKKILADVAEAAPKRQKQSPEMKEALKEFSKPEMSEAQFYIASHRGLGMDGWEIQMSLPVSVEFLKAKSMDHKINEFAKFGSSDPIDVLTMMANAELEKRTGQKLRRPSISTVDLSRQRAKGGMKTVTMHWEVNDPVLAYGLGLDFSKFGGSSKVPSSPDEVKKRMAEALKCADDALALRTRLAGERKSGAKTEEQTNEEWRKFATDANARGFSYQITKLHKLSASAPTVARILAKAEEEKLAEAGAWKFCGKCVRMTPHDENGECKEH